MTSSDYRYQKNTRGYQHQGTVSVEKVATDQTIFKKYLEDWKVKLNTKAKNLKENLETYYSSCVQITSPFIITTETGNVFMDVSIVSQLNHFLCVAFCIFLNTVNLAI